MSCSKRRAPLLQKLVNRLVELLDGRRIFVARGVDDAVADVVFEDDAADAFERGVDSGKLDQHVAAVFALFHHALDLFEVADEARRAVDRCQASVLVS